MFCHSHHLCFSLIFCTTPTPGHVGSKFFFLICQNLDLAVGCNYFQRRCFSSDTISVSSELSETNPSLFNCINILLGHICLHELGLCHQRLEGGRGSQSASALQTHCFLLQQQTSHTSLLGSRLLPRGKNRKRTVSLWGSSSALNRAIYYHSISKTCC